MTREYVSFPTANARDEFCSAVDKALGLPADVPGPSGLIIHIETWCAVYDASASSFIARIDDVILPPVIGLRVTIKARNGSDKQVTISLAGTTRSVPRSDTWTVVEPRGGLEAPLVQEARGR